jgi:hypothetical protein|tara:strand:+ start:283 stop:747 length:465 start_codon:yes stop_codon:yes gene_type:complete
MQVEPPVRKTKKKTRKRQKRMSVEDHKRTILTAMKKYQIHVRNSVGIITTTSGATGLTSEYNSILLSQQNHRIAQETVQASAQRLVTHVLLPNITLSVSISRLVGIVCSLPEVNDRDFSILMTDTTVGLVERNRRKELSKVRHWLCFLVSNAVV